MELYLWNFKENLAKSKTKPGRGHQLLFSFTPVLLLLVQQQCEVKANPKDFTPDISFD